ncbi:MAG: hypothetical protein RIE52_09615 [Balneola sp.]
MKSIKGGNMSTCGIYTAAGVWYCGYSPADAASMYNDVDDITGYCCASCGQPGFLGSHCGDGGPGGVE